MVVNAARASTPALLAALTGALRAANVGRRWRGEDPLNPSEVLLRVRFGGAVAAPHVAGWQAGLAEVRASGAATPSAALDLLREVFAASIRKRRAIWEDADDRLSACTSALGRLVDAAREDCAKQRAGGASDEWLRVVCDGWRRRALHVLHKHGYGVSRDEYLHEIEARTARGSCGTSWGAILSVCSTDARSTPRSVRTA